MKRMEMLKKACQLAYGEIDGVSALNDTQYAELQKQPEEEAIQQLAHEFLQEAADYNFGK